MLRPKKLEIIRIVEQSHLPVRCALEKLGVLRLLASRRELLLLRDRGIVCGAYISHR